jgi:hypothetical protein
MLHLPWMSSLLMCHLLSLGLHHLLLLLSPPLPYGLLDVVTTFVGPLTITLLLLQPLLFLGQLIVMIFFIQNGSTRWLRRLLLLNGLTRGILCHVPHVFVRSLVSGSKRLRLALMVLLTTIRLILLPVVFSRSNVVIMMRLLPLLLSA